MSACEKYKQHRGTAQKALLKHLLVTGPRMRSLSASATLGCKTKKVSACKKYKVYRGTAQRGRLKQLHFLLAIRAGKSQFWYWNLLAKLTGNKLKTKTFFVSECDSSQFWYGKLLARPSRDALSTY